MHQRKLVFLATQLRQSIYAIDVDSGELELVSDNNGVGFGLRYRGVELMALGPATGAIWISESKAFWRLQFDSKTGDRVVVAR